MADIRCLRVLVALNYDNVRNNDPGHVNLKDNVMFLPSWELLEGFASDCTCTIRKSQQLTFRRNPNTKSRNATTRETTPVTNGISWPVALMVFTLEMPATSMVLSMNKMKQVIVVTVSRCAAADVNRSNTLQGVSVMKRLGSETLRLTLALQSD